MEVSKISLCILVFLASVCSLVLDSGKQLNDSPILYRLLQNVVPVRYDLTLSIDPESSDFTGTVNITFNVVEENHNINYFYLHADLEFIHIESIILNEDIDCTIFGSSKVDILSILCTNSVSGHDNNLVIKYVAKFSTDDGYGMVKSTYLDQGEEKILIESSFKPAYARRAFPCMDEPDLRANFSISVTHPNGYSIISNSPVFSEYNGDSNFQTTVFTVTPKISTYLVSIFLSEFQAATESVSEDDIQFKVFTRPEVANLTNQVVGKYYSKIMAELNDYTEVSYASLNNAECYHVAIPDHLIGMDSVGLFTYRESDLLDEDTKTTNRATQNIVMAMAHKLSQEWYGGYLTTKWWSDVWANEAVATYLKYIIPNQVNQEFDLVNQFVVEVIQKSMLYDGMIFAEPLSSNEADVKDVRDFEDKLDTFNTLKGASILRMINIVLGGDEEFKEALQNHWNRRRRGLDTNGYDLLNDLADIKHAFWYDYFEAWGFSPGLPVIYLQRKSFGFDYDIINITRKRFLYPVEDMDDYEDPYMIPITQTSEGYDFSIDFYENFIEPGEDPDNTFYYGTNAWFMFNIQVTGFYRVNYEDVLWKKIIDRALKNKNERPNIHVLNRAQLVDDIFNIARIGDVTYALAFELADYLVDETDYYPWYSAFNVFSYLIGKLEDDEVEENFKAYILNLMQHIIPLPMEIGGNESHVDVLRNVMALDWACRLGHSGCISYTSIMFKNFKVTQSMDDHNFREVILCNGIRHSENVNEDLDFLWNIYTTTSSVQEQLAILNALGCAESNDILKSYLLKVITPNSGIKKQDVLLVFKSGFSSSMGLEAAMEFLQSNYVNIVSFNRGMRILSEMLYVVAEKLMTDEQVTWLANLLADDIFNDYADVKTKATVFGSVNNYWKKHFQDQVINIFPAASTSMSASTSTSTSSTSTTITSTTSEESTTPITTTESSSEKILLSIYCVALAIILILNVNVMYIS